MLILSTSILYYAPTKSNGIQNMVSTGPCMPPVTNASGLGLAFLVGLILVEPFLARLILARLILARLILARLILARLILARLI